MICKCTLPLVLFLTVRADAVPHALLHNLLHNQVLHELKNANSNLKYFKLPLNRVIELGTQMEI